ncbi:MAG TPA: hypothetical protein V6D17_20240 [Candidatus Obscuribacterales bacterium]
MVPLAVLIIKLGLSSLLQAEARSFSSSCGRRRGPSQARAGGSAGLLELVQAEARSFSSKRKRRSSRVSGTKETLQNPMETEGKKGDYGGITDTPFTTMPENTDGLLNSVKIASP